MLELAVSAGCVDGILWPAHYVPSWFYSFCFCIVRYVWVGAFGASKNGTEFPYRPTLWLRTCHAALTWLSYLVDNQVRAGLALTLCQGRLSVFFTRRFSLDEFCTPSLLCSQNCVFRHQQTKVSFQPWSEMSQPPNIRVKHIPGLHQSGDLTLAVPSTFLHLPHTRGGGAGLHGRFRRDLIGTDIMDWGKNRGRF